jgi:hypothetical protein
MSWKYSRVAVAILEYVELCLLREQLGIEAEAGV